MRAAWVSFDTVGRDCLTEAATAGLEIAVVVTLPGPVDPDRSGQCSFDAAARAVGAPLVEARDVNAPETLAAIAGAGADSAFVVGWSQLVRDEFISLAPR